MNEFIRNFATLLEVTEEDKLKADTRLRDLEEWSSIFSLGIIALIDSEYDVRIKGEDIRNCLTIGDLFILVEERKK